MGQISLSLHFGQYFSKLTIDQIASLNQNGEGPSKGHSPGCSETEVQYEMICHCHDFLVFYAQ